MDSKLTELVNTLMTWLTSLQRKKSRHTVHLYTMYMYCILVSIKFGKTVLSWYWQNLDLVIWMLSVTYRHAYIKFELANCQINNWLGNRKTVRHTRNIIHQGFQSTMWFAVSAVMWWCIPWWITIGQAIWHPDANLIYHSHSGFPITTTSNHSNIQLHTECGHIKIRYN